MWMRTRLACPGTWLPLWAAVFALTALAVLLPAPLSQAAQVKGDGKLKFEIYQDKAKEYRWRLKAANGEILATSGEGYTAKADAKKGVERIQELAATDKLKWEVYEDKAKEYRWRLKAPNGQIVGASSEGYKARPSLEKAIDLIKKGAKTAQVAELP